MHTGATAEGIDAGLSRCSVDVILARDRVAGLLRSVLLAFLAQYLVLERASLLRDGLAAVREARGVLARSGCYVGAWLRG